MPTRTNNRIVIDLQKVAYAWKFWRNQWGDTRAVKPCDCSIRSMSLSHEHAMPYLHDYPCETMVERAKRLGLLDVWKPIVRFRMSATDVLEFTGERAESLWKAWCEKQFGPSKKKGKKK